MTILSEIGQKADPAPKSDLPPDQRLAYRLPHSQAHHVVQEVELVVLEVLEAREALEESSRKNHVYLP